MDSAQLLARRIATSMEIFAEGEPAFVYGAWLAWREACLDQCRLIPPTEFKTPAQGLQ